MTVSSFVVDVQNLMKYNAIRLINSVPKTSHQVSLYVIDPVTNAIYRDRTIIRCRIDK